MDAPHPRPPHEAAGGGRTSACRPWRADWRAFPIARGREFPDALRDARRRAREFGDRAATSAPPAACPSPTVSGRSLQLARCEPRPRSQPIPSASIIAAMSTCATWSLLLAAAELDHELRGLSGRALGKRRAAGPPSTLCRSAQPHLPLNICAAARPSSRSSWWACPAARWGGCPGQGRLLDLEGTSSRARARPGRAARAGADGGASRTPR